MAGRVRKVELLQSIPWVSGRQHAGIVSTSGGCLRACMSSAGGVRYAALCVCVHAVC